MRPPLSALLLASLLAAASLPPPAPAASGAPLDRFVVTFLDSADVPREGEAFLGALVVRSIPALRAAAVLADPGFAEAAPGDPRVSSVERDARGRAMLTPNDPGWGSQATLRAIGADAAWDLWTGDGATIVAVVDTGVDEGHPDLAPNLWQGPGGTHGWNVLEATPEPRDDHGHGTHVAGVIGASLSNGQGVAGLAQVDLMIVKALDASGEGYASDVAAGLDWASARGARVACLALAFPLATQVLADAVALATTRGTLVVASAGERSASAAVQWPAAHADALAVAALDSAGGAAAFSPAGPEIDVAAPGQGAYSTMPTYPVTLTSGGGFAPNYAAMSGTSAAAAHVAGVAALVASADPSLDPAALRARLEATAVDLGVAGRDDATGAGRVDARRALDALDVPPVASAGGPYEVDEGAVVRFTAAGSLGLGLAYAWDVDGDGVVDSTSRELTRVFPDERAGVVTLRVTNATGIAATASAPLVVRNAPPVPRPDLAIVNVTVGAPLTLRGTATDPGAGDVLAATWDFGDGILLAGLVATHAYDEVGAFDATLRVTDGDGGVGSAVTRVNVRGVDLVAEAVTFERPRVLGIAPQLTTINVHAELRNAGPVAVASPVRVRFEYEVGYRSGTLGEVVLAGVPAYGDATATFVWNATGRIGEYRVRAIVDVTGAIEEGSESNNVASGTTTVVTSDPTGTQIAALLDLMLGGSSPGGGSAPGDYDADGIPDRGDFLNAPGEARVFATSRDYLEVRLGTGSTFTLVAPDGKAMSVRSTRAASLVRVYFNGSVEGAPVGVSVTGDLVSALADGTWTIERLSTEGVRPPGFTLSIQGKRLAVVAGADGGEPYNVVHWNWHMQTESSRTRGPTTFGGVIVDPGESLVHARFYALDLSIVATSV